MFLNVFGDIMDNVKYAGFWSRTLATLIDSFIIMIISLPFTMILFYGKFITIQDSEILFSSIFGQTIYYFINYIFPVIFTMYFWIKYSSSPGKKFLRMKIVDKDSLNDLTPKQSIIRYFAYVVSIIPLMIGFIWIAFDKKKQGFHDKLSNTIVICVD